MENVKQVIANIRTEKGEFSGDNLGRVVEAIFEANGHEGITNQQVNELTSEGGLLAGIVTAPQLRGKAVSDGYYKKKTQAEKAGEHGTSQVRKASIVSAIETIASMPKGSLESLGKAKKPELEALSAALIAMSDRQDADAKADA